MGVHGLWKLLEPAGKAVALESLQNKILGVDVSIWLHQAMKGFQDRKGSPLPNAHLLGIFHRVCKLLFYRIKPVFVFDGGVPVLKKNTIAARRKFKGQAARDAKLVAEQLLKNLVKHKAVRKVLGEKAGRNAVSEDHPRKDENLFELPPMVNDLNDYQSLSSDSEASVKYERSGEESDSDQDVKYLSPSKVYAMNLDLHTLDVTSENFRSLPADVRHDILSDLKETRKQSSWGRLHEMPKESNDFSSFQLNRLLKRRTVQVSLEEAEKEMGGKVLSMAELEDIMSAQGVKLEDGTAPSEEAQLKAYTKRIASDVATRFLLVSESSKIKELATDNLSGSKKEMKVDSKEKMKIKQEHQDEWSSDDGSIKEVKIKEEYEEDWSSDDEVRKIAANENLAEQFINEKDTLSQAEILALIQNEKNEDSRDNSILTYVPTTSRPAGVEPTSIKALSEPSTSKAACFEPSTSKTGFKTPTKNKNYVQTRDSPVTVKSDSDNDFDEVMPIEPEIIERVVSVKSANQERKQSIEVVIDKNQSFQPEDDLFADIFPVSETPKEFIQVAPEKVKSPEKSMEKLKNPEKKVTTNVEEKAKSLCSQTEKLQERIEEFVREKMELEQKKARKTADKLVKLQTDDSISEKSNDVDSKEQDSDEKSEERPKSDEEEKEQSPKDLRAPPMSSEELKTLESALEDKHEELLAEKGRQERLAASITDQMCAEAQELLRLFGVPYIVAPMEAEAQCAFLDSLSLTEGTITDDSDIWLFGGNKVYKNFFNQKKHVLQYTSTTIQHYLKLERCHMVLLALLVGSDYTTGLQGIGPVTAMEVLAAFPPAKADKSSENRDAMIEGLRRFRDWWQAGRPQRSAATQQLKNKVKDIQFYEGFPSLAVVDAYLRPAVDESREAFSWGEFDLQGLREFARMKFGWAQAKADEILLPVAKRVAERKNQRLIDAYFNVMPQYNEGEKKMSKRVQKAVRRMDNGEESDSGDVDDPEPVRPQKRKTLQGRGTKKRSAHENDVVSEEERGEVQKTGKPTQKTNAAPRKMVKRAKDEQQDTVENADEDASGPKKSRTTRSVMKDTPRNDNVGSDTLKENNDSPKPRPRQRTSTGVRRIGTKAAQRDGSVESEAIASIDKEAMETAAAVAKSVYQSRKKTNMEKNHSLDAILEEVEPQYPENDAPNIASDFDPKPGTSRDMDQPNTGDGDQDEEEAIVAALHAMDWDDDPWGGFEPPREKLYFGGVRKNPTKPRRAPQPQPPPPPSPSPQPFDTRGYRPGSLTLDRIESRVTQPQMEWNSPCAKIPQKERDRQQAEESKMKAIKLFKAAGAIKKSRLLGDDPATSRRRTKKKKPVAKVRELILSEESSSDD